METNTKAAPYGEPLIVWQANRDKLCPDHWLTRRASQRIKHYFIYVAPAPFFAGFKRFDDWMMALMKMPGGMVVG